MKHLYDEVLRRFPEVAELLSEDDVDLPYVVVGSISEWLASTDLAPSVVQRVVDFDRWCDSQPRGEDARSDILTITTVAFREKLFENDALLALIPQLMTLDELINNKDYLTTWVGADRYKAALHRFGVTAN